MSNLVANLATGVGVYDATTVNNTTIDTLSATAGAGDLSLNAPQQQYMMFNNNVTTPAIATGNGISFSGWFFPTGSQTAGSTIFDISGTGVTACALYYADASNHLAGMFNGVPVIQSTTAITPDTWHFFCYTVYCTNLGSALQTLYIDNLPPVSAMGSYYTSFSIGASYPGTAAYIGYGAQSTANTPVPLTFFNGKIDDFRFYSRVISTPEVNVLYKFNYKSGAIPTIAAQMNYDLTYVNAVQIDVSGTFSGLYVTRTAVATNATTTTSISCANLVFVNATTWAYIDTGVAPDTAYTYSITPYVMNSASATAVVPAGQAVTTPLVNGYFNQGTGLPATGTSMAITAANLPGWTVTSTGGGGTVFLCNGKIASISTGALPSTITYYVAISQASIATTTIQQYVNIYAGTNGILSFFAWPKDYSYYSSYSTLTVTLDSMTLLSAYSVPANLTTNTPYTSFNLPFSVATTGTYLLSFTVADTSSALTGLNIAGVQIKTQSMTAVGYKAIDPYMLALYYPFDVNTVANNVVYDFAGGVGVADASLNGGAVLSTTPAPLIGTADVAFNGTSSYVKMGSWSLPPDVSGNGFSITGWFYPGSVTSNTNSVLCSFQTNPSSMTNSIVVSLNQGIIDFSFNSVGLDFTSFIAGYGAKYQTNAWNFFAVTCTRGAVSAQSSYTFYLNNVALVTIPFAWPTTNAVAGQLYGYNYLGGVPLSYQLGYFLGSMNDFRVYNRCLTAQDVFGLWSFAFANSNSFSNLIDSTGCRMYYPMDQGTDIVQTPPSSFGTFTISSVSTTGFTLSWSGNTGSTVTYGFTANGTTISPSSTTLVSGFVTGYTFSGLTTPTSGQNYAWAVVATATASSGSVITAALSVLIPPTDFGNVSVSATTMTGVTVSWTGAIGNNINYFINVNGLVVTPSSLTTGGTCTAVLTNLTYPTSGQGYQWSIYVVASNPVGSKQSSTVLATPPPSAFTSYTPYDVSSNGFRLTWSGGVGSGVTYSYLINGASTGFTSSGTDPVAGVRFNNVTAPLLSQNFAWSIVTRSTNATGYTDSAAWIVYAPPLAFNSFAVTAVSTSGFSLTWRGTQGTGVTYSLTANGTAVAAGSSYTPSGYVGGYVYSGLPAANSSYNWAVVVTASNQVASTGGGSVSSTVTVYSAPTAFGMFTVSSVTNSGFMLAWTGTLGYNVAYSYTVNGLSTGFTTAGTLSSTGVTFSGVTFANTWAVIVTANNLGLSSYLGGASIQSTSQTITPPPSDFGLFTTTGIIANGFTLSWSGGTGSGVTYSYTVNGLTTGFTTSGTNPSTGITFSGLSGTSWNVVVTATNSVGTSRGTVPTITSLATAITNLTALSVTQTSFTLVWKGGLGTGVTNNVYVNGSLTPVVMNATTVAGYDNAYTLSTMTPGIIISRVVTSSPLPDLTSSNNYEWILSVNAVTGGGTVTASLTVIPAPTAFGTFTINPLSSGSNGFFMSFTGANGYNVSYTFTINGAAATPTSGSYSAGYTFSGLTAPGSAKSYAWAVIVTATNSGGSVTSPTKTINTFTISSISYAGSNVASYSGDLKSGNGILNSSFNAASHTYNTFAFGQYSSYVINYSCYVSVPVQLFVVAGGGAGGTSSYNTFGYGAGGGGGGGVVMTSKTLTPTAGNTITINVANISQPGSAGLAVSGNNSSLTVASSWSVTGVGGGGGASQNAAALTGGSGGGGGGTQSSSATTNANLGYSGGSGSSGGGGGAGSVGVDSTGSFDGVGGTGMAISTSYPGLYYFQPTNYSQFGAYYWAAGGGGGGSTETYSTNRADYLTTRAGNGGYGGGGGGARMCINHETDYNSFNSIGLFFTQTRSQYSYITNSYVSCANNDNNGISTGTTPTSSAYGYANGLFYGSAGNMNGGSGAPNTGAGGGGGANGGSGGTGGSGIVVIAFQLQ